MVFTGTTLPLSLDKTTKTKVNMTRTRMIMMMTTTTTHRVEFVGWCGCPKRVLCCSHHKVTRKMAMLHCHQWGVFGMC
jgi:hypothetical protein